ncbi:MAG TPA: hypothetical protein VGK89_11115 [Candidatus Eisenbacteria bacterium]
MSDLALPPLTRIERVALAAALALTAVLLWPLRHFVTDDTFVHLQVARHLANGQGLTFNVGERVNGCTSPLWVALLADGIALGLDGLAVARALGLLAALGSVVLFLQLARRTLAAPGLCALATLAWACHAWMLQWALSGTETPLATALVLAGFVAYTGGRRLRARPAWAGTLWALAALTTPEAVVLLVLWAVLRLADAEGRSGLVRLAAGVAPPLLLYGGWLVFARLYFGAFWPQAPVAASAAVPHGDLGAPMRIAAATDGLLAVALVVARVVARPRMPDARAWAAWLLPLAWLLGVPVLLVARGTPVTSRHLVPLLPVVGWYAWRAVEDGWMGESPDAARRRRGLVLAAALAAGVVAQNLVVYARYVVPYVRAFTAGYEGSLVRWGRWFGAHAPPEAAIATPDIGAIAYFSERRVVDLSGLATPAMVPLLERGGTKDVVTRLRFAPFARPEFVVDRAPGANDLMRLSPFADCLTPLGHDPAPLSATAGADSSVYSFYRVEWDCVDASGTPR